MRTINEKGVALIKEFEGCKLEAYRDIRGIWTIGFGSTYGVYPGMHISEAQAESLLKAHLVPLEVEMSRLIKVPLTDNQFSALVCFAYNVGVGSFMHSTLLKLLNQGKLPEAAEHLLDWDKAGGVSVPGLKRRREAERAFFLS